MVAVCKLAALHKQNNRCRLVSTSSLPPHCKPLRLCANSPPLFYTVHSVTQFYGFVLTLSGHMLAVCTPTSHHKQNNKRRLACISSSSSQYQHHGFVQTRLFFSTVQKVSYTSAAPYSHGQPIRLPSASQTVTTNKITKFG